jgi:hypothetical protein
MHKTWMDGWNMWVSCSSVTLQHKASCMGQILEREILDLCDSVLRELSTNVFDIIIQYFLTEIWPFECSDS